MDKLERFLFPDEPLSIGKELQQKIETSLAIKKEKVIEECFKQAGFEDVLEKALNGDTSLIFINYDDKGCQRWYVNDGSKDGFLVVTFHNPEITFVENIMTGNFTVASEIKYTINKKK